MADQATRARLDRAAEAIAALLGVDSADVWIRDGHGHAEVVLEVDQAERLVALAQRLPA